ncbi:MAG: GIY-YIG nuclease family protein [Oligoflexales bacterium]|nr:GIY-YIG nuclease family protein [Oligoflexales bacterium]
MKINELGNNKLHRVCFSKSKIRAVPPRSGIYLLVNYCHFILYIGISKCLQRRMTEHLSDCSKLQYTPLGRVYWFCFKECSESEFHFYEKGWINQYMLTKGELPYLNKLQAPH